MRASTTELVYTEVASSLELGIGRDVNRASRVIARYFGLEWSIGSSARRLIFTLDGTVDECI